MDITLVDKTLGGYSPDTLVIACYQDSDVPEGLPEVPEAAAMLETLKTEPSFQGKEGEIRSLTLYRDGRLTGFIFLGLGTKDSLDFQGLRRCVNAAVKEARRMKAGTLALGPLGYNAGLREGDIIRILTEITLLSCYSFQTYKTRKMENSLKRVCLVCSQPDSPVIRSGFREGMVLGRAVILARDLVNEPANVLDPPEFARRVAEEGDRQGFEVEVYDEKKILRLGMTAFLEVARASDIPPRLIVLRYNGRGGETRGVTALVGKGVTYDTGGLSIKTNDQMDTMKRDMGGAASVLGAVSAAAQLALPIRLVGVIAACENMVSGRSYRPGDIIGSMAGKTIHIGNTDGEGRLLLVDAIHYAIEHEHAERIIDLATLTGDATRMMGHTADVVISNDDGFYAQLQMASEYSGERVFRLPVYEEHRELIRSDIADLTNAPVKAKTIAAGAFIGEFVQNRPWLHIDIAPTAWVNEDTDYRTKGGTGTEVRNIYYLLKRLSGRDMKVSSDNPSADFQEDTGV
ncbi:MAG: leucyl aminopeptidase [Spirochaetales bacterium]|nr:leucyl aminopeptidase [Spirochaetales bacterium]